MDDRTMLELAAKAAGVVIRGSCDGECCMDIGDGEPIYWNPLTDDGDALRLAVKLGLVLSIDLMLGGETEAWPYTHESRLVGEEHNGDPCAATRRAIVRAAAAIGKEKA